jgi:hypothetical protein
MKRLIALVLAAAPAWALTPNLSSNLVDLMYVPAAGTFYGKTSVGMGQMEGEVGANGDLEYRTTTVSQEVRYGITERWQVFASYTELLTGDFDFSDGAGGKFSKENTGADRPELGVLWRVGNPSDTLLTSDLYAAYSPGMGDARYNIGNDAVQGPRDSDGIILGSRFGRKWNEFEFVMDLRFTFHGDGETIEADTPDATYEADRHTAIWYGGAIQLPVGESLRVKVGLHFNHVSSYPTEPKVGTGKVTVGPRRSTIFNLGALWAVSPEKIALGLDLGYEVLGNRTLSSVNYKDFTDLSGLLSARYQF